MGIKSQYINNNHNAFVVETTRNQLAKDRNHATLKKTYSNIYPEIKNLNTNVFWDKKFTTHLGYEEQDEFTKEKIDYIISLLSTAPAKILDLGFGQGYFEERLMQKEITHQIFGVDISKIAVLRAKKRFKGTFTEGNILKLNNIYKKDEFDVIVAIEVVEHIVPSEILLLLRQINHKIKTGGAFILSTPLNEGLEHMKENPNSHVRCYTPDIIKAELEISGFKIKEEKTFYAFSKYYHLKKVLAKILRNHWQPNNIVVKAIKI